MEKPLSKQTFPLVITLVIFLILATLLSTSAISKAGLSDTQYGNDFTVFYAAAKNFYYQNDPYNHKIAAKTPYLYLPLFALLIMPLGLMSLANAATIWYWLNILFTILLLVCCTRLVSKERSKQVPIIIILFILSSRLILDNLFWGQVNILVALLIAIWFLAKENSYKWLGELALAIAISIKITPILLTFYLILKRRWQDLINLSICFSLITFISLIPLGSNSFVLLKGWFQRTILNKEGFNWAYAGNQSLRGTLERLFTTTSTESIYYPTVNIITLPSKTSQLIFIFTAFSLVFYFSYKTIRQIKGVNQVNKLLDWQVGALCALMLLLSNLSWKAHFIFLTLPLAIIIKIALFGKRLSKISLAVLIVFFLLISLTTQPIIGVKLHQWFETHSYYCLITLIIFFLCLNLKDQEI
ncbi:MAG: DUF2029 domain-containing protein [Acidobacteria bacterium]|nr:DUF2029 domain-containing protein [Acidobacteriota bacterium]